MTYFPFAPKIGDDYVLTSPTGVRAVFNDTTDPDYVGHLTEVVGLDSAEIREVFEDATQSDGGVHGDFWLGRRPITMNGKIVNPVNDADRNIKMDKVMRASMALRGDSILSWRPIVRQENIVTNPRAVNDTAGWATSAVSGLTAGATLTRVTGQTPPVGTTAFNLVTTTTSNTGAYIQVPAQAGVPISFSIAAKRSAGTGSLALFVGNLGTQITTIGSTSGWVVYTVTFTPTVTDPATNILLRDTGTSSNTFQFSDVMLSPTGNTAYFDGDTAGYYWQANPHSSASGDFIEMFTPVRRQQPLRYTGGWVKEFQMQMVSEWATVFSTGTHTVTSANTVGASAENQGSYPAAPKFRITGASTNPQIAVTGAGSGTLKTTGLSISAGNWVEIDCYNHTAVNQAGQSMNRYIDFAGTTSWPILNSGVNTVTLTNGGTLLTTWRDTWA